MQATVEKIPDPEKLVDGQALALALFPPGQRPPINLQELRKFRHGCFSALPAQPLAKLAATRSAIACRRFLLLPLEITFARFGVFRAHKLAMRQHT